MHGIKWRMTHQSCRAGFPCPGHAISDCDVTSSRKVAVALESSLPSQFRPASNCGKPNRKYSIRRMRRKKFFPILFVLLTEAENWISLLSCLFVYPHRGVSQHDPGSLALYSALYVTRLTKSTMTFPLRLCAVSFIYLSNRLALLHHHHHKAGPSQASLFNFIR